MSFLPEGYKMPNESDQLRLALGKLPSSAQNGSRSYLIRLARAFDRRPSDTLAHQLEQFGIVPDHSDQDWGTDEGKRGNYKHIPDSGSKEKY